MSALRLGGIWTTKGTILLVEIQSLTNQFAEEVFNLLLLVSRWSCKHVLPAISWPWTLSQTTVLKTFEFLRLLEDKITPNFSEGQNLLRKEKSSPTPTYCTRACRPYWMLHFKIRENISREQNNNKLVVWKVCQESSVEVKFTKVIPLKQQHFWNNVAGWRRWEQMGSVCLLFGEKTKPYFSRFSSFPQSGTAVENDGDDLGSFHIYRTKVNRYLVRHVSCWVGLHLSK